MKIHVISNRSILTDEDLAEMCSDWLTGKRWDRGAYNVAVDQYGMITSISCPCCQRATNCQIEAGPDLSVSMRRLPMSHELPLVGHLAFPPKPVLSGAFSVPKTGDLKRSPTYVKINRWTLEDAPPDLMGSWWVYCNSGEGANPAQVVYFNPETGALTLEGWTSCQDIDLNWLLTAYRRVPAPE